MLKLTWLAAWAASRTLDLLDLAAHGQGSAPTQAKEEINVESNWLRNDDAGATDVHESAELLSSSCVMTPCKVGLS